MDSVVDRYFPIVDALETELETLEERMFSGGAARAKGTAGEPLPLKPCPPSAISSRPRVTRGRRLPGFVSARSRTSAGALAPQSVQGVDPHGKWPAVYTYSAGVQRDLGGKRPAVGRIAHPVAHEDDVRCHSDPPLVNA